MFIGVKNTLCSYAPCNCQDQVRGEVATHDIFKRNILKAQESMSKCVHKLPVFANIPHLINNSQGRAQILRVVGILFTMRPWQGCEFVKLLTKLVCLLSKAYA